MANGITICKEEFKRLPLKEQMLIIFENTESANKKLDKYRFHQKIQYVGGAVIIAALIWMAEIHIVKP